MPTIIDHIISGNASNCNIPADSVEQAVSRLRRGPAARLLARLSKWSGDYANYQMETGAWRKLALQPGIAGGG